MDKYFSYIVYMLFFSTSQKNTVIAGVPELYNTLKVEAEFSKRSSFYSFQGQKSRFPCLKKEICLFLGSKKADFST